MQRTLWQPIFSALSTSHTASKLVDFSTCEISDALIKLKLPHGGYLPDINMFSPLNSGLRICGPAYTVRLVLGSDTTAPKLSTHFVDATPAGSIIVISSPPGWVLFQVSGQITRFVFLPFRGQECRMGWAYDCRCNGSLSQGGNHLREMPRPR